MPGAPFKSALGLSGQVARSFAATNPHPTTDVILSEPGSPARGLGVLGWSSEESAFLEIRQRMFPTNFFSNPCS
jgi:hypothetical protein